MSEFDDTNEDKNYAPNKSDNLSTDKCILGIQGQDTTITSRNTSEMKHVFQETTLKCNENREIRKRWSHCYQENTAKDGSV